MSLEMSAPSRVLFFFSKWRQRFFNTKTETKYNKNKQQKRNTTIYLPHGVQVLAWRHINKMQKSLKDFVELYHEYIRNIF